MIGNVHTSLIPKVAHIFKALYDLDIVSEEILIDWHNKVNYHRIRIVHLELTQYVYKIIELIIK